MSDEILALTYINWDLSGETKLSKEIRPTIPTELHCPSTQTGLLKGIYLTLCPALLNPKRYSFSFPISLTGFIES